MVASCNIVLMEYLTMAGANVTYISPLAQNELLLAILSVTERTIVAEVI